VRSVNYVARNRVILPTTLSFANQDLIVAAPLHLCHRSPECCDPRDEEHCCSLYRNRLSCVVYDLPFVWDDTYIHIDVFIILFLCTEQIILSAMIVFWLMHLPICCSVRRNLIPAWPNLIYWFHKSPFACRKYSIKVVLLYCGSSILYSTSLSHSTKHCLNLYIYIYIYIYIYCVCVCIGILGRGEWSSTRPCRFTPGESTQGTHWIVGWVGSRVGLDAMEKRKSCTAGIEPGPSNRLRSLERIFFLIRMLGGGVQAGSTRHVGHW
jgi:hypothetical protein